LTFDPPAEVIRIREKLASRVAEQEQLTGQELT
jgi:hypothetical protein